MLPSPRQRQLREREMETGPVSQIVKYAGRRETDDAGCPRKVKTREVCSGRPVRRLRSITAEWPQMEEMTQSRSVEAKSLGL